MVVEFSSISALFSLLVVVILPLVVVKQAEWWLGRLLPTSVGRTLDSYMYVYKTRPADV